MWFSRFFFGMTLFTSVLGLVLSCATVHGEDYAHPLNADGEMVRDAQTPLGLMISIQEDRAMSSKHFRLFTVTMENKTGTWQRIERVNIDFLTKRANQGLIITSGRDLKDWYAAADANRQINETNRQMFLGAVAIASGVAVHTSGNENVGRLGGFAFLTSTTLLYAPKLRGKNANFEFGDIDAEELKKDDESRPPTVFPETHLLGGKFAIPPGLFVKKWIVVSANDQKLLKNMRYVALDYQTDKGTDEAVRICLPRLDVRNNSTRDKVRNKSTDREKTDPKCVLKGTYSKSSR